MIFTNLAVLYSLIPLAIVLFVILKKKVVRDSDRIYKINKRFIFITRLLIFSLLLLAAAMPYIEYHDTNGNVTAIKVLVDNSESMKLLDKEGALGKLDSSDLPVQIINLELGEYSSIGSSVLNNIAPDETVLLVTDGQSNFGPQLEDIALFASSINTKLFALELEDEEKDAAIFIDGPEKVVADVENTFTIKTAATGKDAPKILVTIDDEVVYDAKYVQPVEIRKTFHAGVHIIKAVIESEDYFLQNNVFVKAVMVIKKPKVLFYSGRDSPLYQLYDDFYDIDYVEKLPVDLIGYHAAVLDNVNAKGLSNNDIDALDRFLIDENGVLVVGGKDSYDYGNYNKSQITKMLPVAIGKAKKKQDDVSLVVMLDSGASGMEEIKPGITKFDVQKSVTADILGGISGKNKVALIEANYYLNTITGLSELEPKRQAVLDELALLTPHGFSQLRFAYKQAYDMLKLNTGSKNIVIITDGELVPQDQAATLDIVLKARSDGIKTFIVAVGDKADESFLKAMKTMGGGEYFKADETSKLRLYFGSSGDDSEQKDLEIFVYDSNHFITQDIQDLGKIYGFNQVYPKANSRMLLTTSKGDPVLTIWNYGLGRVAALSTDDGTMWNPQMFKESNSKALIKAMNWLIENPERKNDVVVEIPQLRAGESSTITVRAKTLPESKLNFIEYEKGIYKAQFYTQETGVVDILGNAASVNYPLEYMNIGINDDLRRAVQITGGSMIDEIDEDAIKSMTKVEYTRTRDMSWLFIFFGLIIYLIEITIRRIVEIKASRGK